MASSRHPQAHRLGEEHAADHQGDEDGGGGQAAPRAGGGAQARVRTRRSSTRVLIALVARADEARAPAARAARRRVARLLVITSDRGLCGGFNANLIAPREAFIAEHRDRDDVELVRRRPQGPSTIYAAPARSIRRATRGHYRRRRGHRPRRRWSREPRRPRLRGDEIDGVYLVYSRVPVGALAGADGRAAPAGRAREPARATAPTDADYIYEPTAPRAARAPAAALHRDRRSSAPCSSRGQRARRPHDGDGERHQRTPAT